MRVRIHRGAREIGGTCVELEVEDGRLLLDLGLPLGIGRGGTVGLPDVPGLADGADAALLGVVVSHAHLDHYGLLAHAHPQVPVYAGEATTRILRAAAFFSPAGIVLRPTGFLRDRDALKIGPFQVTPYLVDHSAYDSYALLVEAGGQAALLQRRPSRSWPEAGRLSAARGRSAARR